MSRSHTPSNSNSDIPHITVTSPPGNSLLPLLDADATRADAVSFSPATRLVVPSPSGTASVTSSTRHTPVGAALAQTPSGGTSPHMRSSTGTDGDTQQSLAPAQLSPARGVGGVGSGDGGGSHPSQARGYTPLGVSGGGEEEGDLTLGDVLPALAGGALRRVLRLLWVGTLVVGLMTGNAMIVICLNFWLAQFPTSPGRYTVFAVSGMIFSFFFLLAFGLYVLICRPDLTFLRHKFGWKLLFGMAVMDTLNSGMAIYAAPQTAEVLQALFTALVPVYAAVFTKFILKDPRQYCNRYVLVSFALIITGVLTASFFYLGDGAESTVVKETSAWVLSLVANTNNSDSSSSSSSSESGSSESGSEVSPAPRKKSDAVWWSLIFFFSVIPTVLMNVAQTVYMTRYTFDADFVSEARAVLAVDGGDDENVNENENENGNVNSVVQMAGMDAAAWHPHNASDTAVKLVMLAADTTLQSFLTLLLMPMDALPWFGSSASVPETWTNFMTGLDCLFNCPNNFAFCCLYCCGFVLVYICAAYLNQFSVTLCSMVSQLSAPVTALVIVVFPRLNPSEDTAPWYASTISACILGLGTYLYVVWDEDTAAEKHVGEVRLKLQLLGLLNRMDTAAAGPSAPQTSARTDACGHAVTYMRVETRPDDGEEQDNA